MEKEELKLLLKIVEYMVENYNGEMVDLSNNLVDMLTENLPYKSEEEKEDFLNLLSEWRFWEDVEKFALKIINNKE